MAEGENFNPDEVALPKANTDKDSSVKNSLGWLTRATSRILKGRSKISEMDAETTSVNNHDNRPISKDTKYLTQHLEPIERRDFGWDKGVAPSLVLEYPLADIKYENQGEVKLEAGNIHINYDYQPASMELLSQDDNPAKWRKITNLTIENVSNGARINIFDLLPPEYRIVVRDWHNMFGVSRYDETANVGVSPDLKVIKVGDNIQVPAVLVALFHEIGHVASESTHPEYSWGEEMAKARGAIKTFHQPLSEEMQSKILMSERDAWGFALKTLKPLLEGQSDDAIFTMKRIQDHTHNNSLKKYSDAIRFKQKTA